MTLASLGGYQESEWSIRLVASAIFAGILCLVAALERLQLTLRETEASRWWASNGRDVLNFFALAILSYGLKLLGYFGPMVLLLAGCMVVALTAVQGVLGSDRAAGWGSLVLT